MHRKSAIKIVLIYAVLAAIWIVASDSLPLTFVHTAASMAYISILKGIMFVIVTAVVLYWLMITLGRSALIRYRTLFQVNPLPMWVFDMSTSRFLAVNDAAIAHYGYSRNEFLAMSIFDIRPQEDVAKLRAHLAKLNGKTLDEAGIWRHLRKDGTIIDVEITSSVVAFDGRRAMMVLANDITQRLKATADLEKSETRYRALTEQAISGVFMLDGERIEYLNPRAAEIFGYAPAELIGQSVEMVICPDDMGRVRHNIEALASGESTSLRAEFRCRRKDGVEILIGTHGTGAEVEGKRVILGMLQDISENRRAADTILEYATRLKRALLGTVDAVSRMVEMRDPYTAGHEHRVGVLAADIAAEMGMSDDVQTGLRIAGAVHDVGKITVPSEILTKPGRLSPVEYELVKEHAQKGYDVLNSVDFSWPVAEVARQHHERMDGSGYPRGLKGEDIIIEARITAVADVVESMASHRPYRASLGVDKALVEIESHAGQLYDSNVAAACLRLFRDKGYQLPA